MKDRIITSTAAAALLTCMPSQPIEAQSSDTLSLTWSTLDAGGQRSSNPAGIGLHGTIGQWDASPSAREPGGPLSLRGGFWVGRRDGGLFSDRFEQ